MQLKNMPAFLRPRNKYKPNLREAYESWNIVKGDKIGVVDGPCKGQQGVVLAVLRDKKRVIVEGVNMVRARGSTSAPPWGMAQQRDQGVGWLAVLAGARRPPNRLMNLASICPSRARRASSILPPPRLGPLGPLAAP